MPKKNIYIKDADVEIFEKAEQLGGESISVIIAEILRKFMEQKEAEAAGYQEYVLEVGTAYDDTKKVKFIGRLLADGTTYHGSTSDGRDRGNTWEIYQTKAGKIIVYLDNWSRWDGERDRMYYAVLDNLPGYDDTMFSNGGYPYTVPGNILEDAAAGLGREMVEYID